MHTSFFFTLQIGVKTFNDIFFFLSLVHSLCTNAATFGIHLQIYFYSEFLFSFFFFILKFILVSSRFYSNVASIKTIMLYTCNQCMLVFRRKFTCKRQRGKKRKKKSSFFLFRPLLRSIRFSFHIILFVACCFFFLCVDRHFRWKNINAQICLGRNVFVIYVLCVRVCAGLFFFAGSFGSEVLMRCDDFEMCYIFVN